MIHPYIFRKESYSYIFRKESYSYKNWILLNKIPHLGSKKCRQLVEWFGSPQKVLSASAKSLSLVPGLGKEAITSLIQGAKNIDINEDLKRIDELNIGVISFRDSLYPSPLKTIFDPPFLLYVKGKLKKEESDTLAIVGTRRPTTYGKLMARRLARDLAREGITIVSGMARGIDTAAHQGALEVGGRTIAVLGSGVDVIYPPENKKLVVEIIKKGAVISEYPLGTEPNAPHFPQRNRIISGLAKGVLVVEAPLRSGALITADFALEQGREVFAIPGNITNPNAQGVNRLVKEGAKLVECVEDILEELDFSLLNKKEKKTFDEEIPSLFSEERKVLELLEEEPLHIDSLVSKSGLPASKVGGLLMKLQLKGLARELPGKLFVRDR